MSVTSLVHEELPDIQGLITTGYGHLTCSRFVFLSVIDPKKVRQWLAEIAGDITTSARRPSGTPKPEFAINIAFTFRGLQWLGLPIETQQQFAREFMEGMSLGERPRVLGDTGDSDPGNWDVGRPSTNRVDDHQILAGQGWLPDADATNTSDTLSPHIILLCYGTDQDVLDRHYDLYAQKFEEAGLKVVYCQDTGRISDYEPFGFRDGISQPYISGSPGKCDPGDTPLNAGEVVLGYLNAYNQVPPSPTVPANVDKNGVLPVATTDNVSRDFGKNGTYLIFRKLAQDVDGFWSYLEEQARVLGLAPGKESVEWLGAKAVGRWKSGAPITLSPDHDNRSLATENNFKFMETDADGLKCPMGSHIRRANPRDCLLPNPERSHVLSNRHRIIRRGRHYEDKRSDAIGKDGVEHGLCFICLNADIQRQFEFIQQTWLNNTKFNGLFDEKDVLLGDNDDGQGRLSIPAEPVRMRLTGIKRFVRVRGGEYYFMPGIRALRFLSGL